MTIKQQSRDCAVIEADATRDCRRRTNDVRHPVERFTLHLSVALRWWLWGPWSREATELLDGLASGSLTVVIVEGIAWQVLEALARDFGAANTPTQTIPTEIIDRTFYDVDRQFQLLAQVGAARTISQSQVIRAGYALAGVRNLPLYEALTVVASEGTGRSLVIADPARYEALKALEGAAPELRDFQAVWLGDYQNL